MNKRRDLVEFCTPTGNVDFSAKIKIGDKYEVLQKGHVLPLADALEGAAIEAECWVGFAFKIEEEIASSLIRDSHDFLLRIQDLDQLRQGLSGLAVFITSLSRQVSPEIMCEPSRAVLGMAMRNQAERLLLNCLVPGSGGSG